MRRPLLLGLLLLALGASLAQAQRQMTLGGHGEIYQVSSGRYGDLFPTAPASEADNVVLAVDVTRPNQPVQRLLMPGTDDSAADLSPFILYESTLDSVFVVWESTDYSHSRMNLIRLDSTGVFSETIPLVTEFWTQKSSPRVAVTTDTFQVPDGSGGWITHRRTIVHTLWWENSGNGDRTVYSPVVLIDGNFLGWNPLYVLDDLAGNAGPGVTMAATPDLAHSPSIGPGRDNQSAIASFLNSHSGQLVALELSLVSQPLTLLASSLNDFILQNGTDTSPTGLQQLGDESRAHVIEVGAHWFNTTALNAIADAAQAAILSASSASQNGLQNIASGARAHVIEVGVALGDRPSGVNSAALSSAWANIGIGPNADPAGAVVVLRMRGVAQHTAPQTPPGKTTILSSCTGTDAVVTWEAPGQLVYVESQADTWSAPRVLTLANGLDLDHAYQIVTQHIYDR